MHPSPTPARPTGAGDRVPGGAARRADQAPARQQEPFAAAHRALPAAALGAARFLLAGRGTWAAPARLRATLWAAGCVAALLPQVLFAQVEGIPAPAGSPPGWQPRWLLATQATALFPSATSNEVLGGVDPGTFYRADAPAENGRYWVYNPLTSGWGWLPAVDTAPGRRPTAEELLAYFKPPDPRTYLYQRWPDSAARMECVIQVESGWDPNARNPLSTASGLAQFLNTTWARTPQGQAGFSPFDPYASIDAFGWMVHGGGSWSEWQAVTMGYC